MRRALPIVLALAAAAAVALAANLLLLGYATNRNDPVGNLSLRAAVITTPTAPPALHTGAIDTVTIVTTTATPTAPPALHTGTIDTVTIVTATPHRADDHGGDD